LLDSSTEYQKVKELAMKVYTTSTI